MFNIKLKISVVAMVWLFLSPTQAATINGAQCKRFLAPALELNSNHFLFNDVLQEFRNPLHERLSSFRLNEGDYEPGSRIHNYVQNVQKTLMQCNQNCEGVIYSIGSNKKSFSCSNLNEKSITQITEIADVMTDDAGTKVSEVDENAPESHFSDLVAELEGMGEQNPTETGRESNSQKETIGEEAAMRARVNQVLQYIEETEPYYIEPEARKRIAW